MRCELLLTMAISFVSLGCSRNAEPSPKEAPSSDLIFGTWEAISLEAFGKEIKGGETLGMRITFGPNKAIWYFNTPEGEKSYDGYCRIDSSKKPGEIDLRQPNSDDPNRTAYGIYQIEGDTLRISMDAKRPRDFTESTLTKLVFKRVR